MKSNTALFIAKRYFFSKKKKNFINILTGISMVGVAVGTIAMVVILSVFNGLERITRELHTSHNPELLVVPKQGKTFVLDAEIQKKIIDLEGVRAITEIIEDNALLRYGDAQMAIKFKGVTENFNQQYALDTRLLDGKFRLKEDAYWYALLGYGVSMQLSVNIRDELTPLTLWYPERDKKVNISDPLKNFRRLSIMAGGVLGIEEQFNQNMIIVPIDFAQELTGYKSERSALEIKTNYDSRKKIRAVQREVQAIIGEDFWVKNADEQQELILKAFKIERLFTFIALSFVMAVASFNIFFSLAMLAIEKRQDIALLESLGARPQFIRNIFLYEGAIIGGVGIISGLVIGFLIVVIQMEFGIVGLGIDSPFHNAYPVELNPLDFIYVALTVLLITAGAAYIPARNAARTKASAHISK
ncbi:MAG: ABC transporter permease [Bernardetiaceae bacterium]|nr:ABC transporter permease [Bernardetiaceae bacterium]